MMTQLSEHPTVKRFHELAGLMNIRESLPPLDAAWLRQLCLEAGADDVGFVEINRPELDDQRDDILKVFPHAKTFISLVVRMNREPLRLTTRSVANVEFHHTSVGAIPFQDESMDFGYSLGVLHHVPDTEAGIRACVRVLKPGAPFLLYLYYAFDNRSGWFRALWKVSDVFRRMISSLPFGPKRVVTDLIALFVYLPLATFSRAMEGLGFKVGSIPLSTYRRHSFYTMRTDSLDRFGTRLEQRFSRTEICKMMEAAGLERVVFSDQMPYWCACGFKKRP